MPFIGTYGSAPNASRGLNAMLTRLELQLQWNEGREWKRNGSMQNHASNSYDFKWFVVACDTECLEQCPAIL